MSRRELVLDALNNKPVERVPVSFWFHFVADKDRARGLEEPAFVERNVEGHRRYFEAAEPDFVKVMSDGYFGYPSGGTFKPQITSIDELEKLQPVSADHPWITGQSALVKRVVALQRDTLYFYNIFGPTTVL
jgi:uroporphyrinogen decarboxylase